MKSLLLFAIFLFCSCTVYEYRAPSSVSEDEMIHLVFDIDWTLVGETQTPEKMDPRKLAQVGEEFYRVHDGAEELVTQLLRDPRVKVSFFSGGGVERNPKLLSKLRLTDGTGQSFLDIAHKVLSFDDLTDLEVLGEKIPQEARFAERYKKDLSKISDNWKRVFMVDDNHFFAPSPEQQRQFLWLGPTKLNYETWSAVPKGTELKALDQKTFDYTPKNFEDFSYQRNRLAFVGEMLLSSLDSEEPLESLRVQWDQAQTEKGILTDSIQETIERGKQRLGTSLFPTAQRQQCDLMIRSILKF